MAAGSTEPSRVHGGDSDCVWDIGVEQWNINRVGVFVAINNSPCARCIIGWPKYGIILMNMNKQESPSHLICTRYPVASSTCSQFIVTAVAIIKVGHSVSTGFVGGPVGIALEYAPVDSYPAVFPTK